MNDKQQLAAMGEHMAEQTEQTKQEVQPLCMAKRIEELEAQVRVMGGLLREAVSWMDDHPAMPDSSMMHAALAGNLPVPAVLEGWKLVPVEPTESMIGHGCGASVMVVSEVVRAYGAMLAAAPSPDSDK